MFRGKQDSFYLGETKTSFTGEKKSELLKTTGFSQGKMRGRSSYEANNMQNGWENRKPSCTACVLCGFGRVWL